MNNYSLDVNSRTTVIGMLGVASAGFASLIAWFFDVISVELAAPTGVAVFAGLYFVLDRFAWRWPLVARALGVPDLDGNWEGELVRTKLAGDMTESRKVSMTITQRWSSMSIVFHGQSSTSTASVISFSISDPKQPEIRWIYDARDTTGQVSKHRYGEGSTRLALQPCEGKRVLRGTYYTSKLSSGSLSLTESSNAKSS